ncbi:hypothetical protein ACIBG0_30915 [Nocardia sp. NPDC050630]|uniref:hypothetical protein n=1 Tax=Nocardia sp. NPDC050630 TaxID=3364321 RepID=UPI0037A1282D
MTTAAEDIRLVAGSGDGEFMRECPARISASMATPDVAAVSAAASQRRLAIF